MEITKETTMYNQRRYGKPWIAKVDFKTSTKGDFAWGDWTGDHYNGGEGVLTISAKAGEIIAEGQKDNRNPRNSAPSFYVVTPEGELDPLGDKGDAYKYYLVNRTPNRDTLIAEKAMLEHRIVKINTLLDAEL